MDLVPSLLPAPVLLLQPAVQDIFKALCDCAALNPDAEEEGECVEVLRCVEGVRSHFYA